MLYSGGFFPPADQRLMNRIPAADSDTLRDTDWPFEDPRLPELLFRYRARNFPDSLTAEEWSRWETERSRRLREPLSDGQLDANRFFAELNEARSSADGDGAALAVLDAVEAWGRELLREP
jgi:exodeoxyribonuclease-1